MCTTHEVPRGRGGVTHQGLEVEDVILGCGGGWFGGEAREKNL